MKPLLAIALLSLAFATHSPRQQPSLNAPMRIGTAKPVDASVVNQRTVTLPLIPGQSRAAVAVLPIHPHSTNIPVLLLQFDLATNGVQQYEVAQGPSESLLTTNECTASNGTVAFLPGRAQHLFRVRAINGGAFGNWSSNLYVNLPSDLTGFDYSGKGYAGWFTKAGHTDALVAVHSGNAVFTASPTNDTMESFAIPDTNWYHLRRQ
jgi:hypothetical protein